MTETILAVVGVIALVTGLALLRARTGNKFDIKTSDIALALVPVALWMLLTDKVKELTVGDVKIVTAFREASASPVENQVTPLPVADVDSGGNMLSTSTLMPMTAMSPYAGSPSGDLLVTAGTAGAGGGFVDVGVTRATASATVTTNLTVMNGAELEARTIEASHGGLFFKDGRHEATLAPGAHGCWKGVAKAAILVLPNPASAISTRFTSPRVINSASGIWTPPNSRIWRTSSNAPVPPSSNVTDSASSSCDDGTSANTSSSARDSEACHCGAL